MSKSSLIAAVTKESSTFFNKNKTINSRNSEKNNISNNNGKERNNNNKKLSATTPTATTAGRKLPSSPVTQGITANDINAKKSFKRNDQLIIGHYLHENDFAFIDEDDDNNNINRNNIINNCNEMNNYEINLKLSNNNNNNNNNVVINCNGKTLNNNNNLKNKNLIATDDGQQLMNDEHDRDDKNDVNDRNNVLNKTNSNNNNNKDEENLVKVVVADTKSSTAIHTNVLEHPRQQQKVNQLPQNQLQYQQSQQNNHQQQQQLQQHHTVAVVSNAGKKCKKQSDIKCKSQGFSNNNINKNNISSWSCSCFSCTNDKDNDSIADLKVTTDGDTAKKTTDQLLGKPAKTPTIGTSAVVADSCSSENCEKSKSIETSAAAAVATAKQENCENSENAKSEIVMRRANGEEANMLTAAVTPATTTPSTFSFMDTIDTNGLADDDDDENDPYAQLEIYLEKVKNEITEVFEQLKITEEIYENNNNNGKEVDQQSQLTITNNGNANSKQSSAAIVPAVDGGVLAGVAAVEVGAIAIGSTTSVSAKPDVVAGTMKDYHKTAESQNYLEQRKCMTARRTPKKSNTIDIAKRLSQSNSRLDENWNCMEKFDDLIENEIKNLLVLNADAKTRTMPARTTSYDYSKKSNNDVAKRPARNDNTTSSSNILKLEKHSCISLQSFFNTSTKSLPEYGIKTLHDKKPPICTSKKTLSSSSNSGSTNSSNKSNSNNNTYFNGKKIDYILKIDERDLLYDEDNENKMNQEIATQTSPSIESAKNMKESYSTIWTSDESILKGHHNLDEDNKSTSSSVCEDNSGLLSSGKSGNSLDSTSELENAESGIGTATPPKDKDDSSWGKRHSFSRSDSASGWIRRESVMTQTNPVSVRSINRTNSTNGGGSDYDNDGIDNLSLYDANESENDEFLIMMNNFEPCNAKSVDGNKNMDNSFSTDSSSSTKLSIENDDENDVVLRNKMIYSSKSGFDKNVTRNAISFPVNYLVNAKNSYSLPHNNKRIITTNASKENGSATKVLPKRPFYLPLEQEPFQNNNSTNIVDLPSPSSASLHSGCGNLIVEELGTKSNSAPILLKKDAKNEKYAGQTGLRYSRSQSDRYLAEIEAIEACKWLRAAGFPQYAQMYEDLQFPIDLSGVAKDHPFLENDPLQSLYRRLVALNRCATMRLDGQHKQHEQHDDSDDDSCALSENWTFQQQSRRWSRVGETGPIGLNSTAVGGVNINNNNNNNSNLQNNNMGSRESTPDRLDHQNMNIPAFGTPPGGGGISGAATAGQQESAEDVQVKFRRTGSERLKDGAKAFLRRVESIKSRRRKRQNRDGVVISGPQVLDLSQMNQKMCDLKCIDIATNSTPSSPMPSPSVMPPRSPIKCPAQYYGDMKNTYSSLDSNKLGANNSPNHLSPLHYSKQKSSSIVLTTPKTYQKSHSSRSSPLHFFTNHHYTHHNSSNNHAKLKESKSGDDSSSICSETSQDSSGGSSTTASKKMSRARRFLQRSVKLGEDTGALSDSECQPIMRKEKYFKESNANTNSLQVKESKIVRGGSLNLGKESKRYRENFKSKSFRSRSAVRNDESEDDGRSGRVRTPVARWHSFQSAEKPESLNLRVPSMKMRESMDRGIQMASMSCGQLQVIRKLALVTLTGYMERYCPTHRTGWNWELPKFIKKIKAPDYKDKRIFGVPILLSVQRTGYTIPRSIEAAIKWLKLNAMDQIGIFRKSGVKSRITKLKLIVENSDDDNMHIFEDQQAYDVADMVKLYFRELPECLLTTKLSETFVAIFQHLPEEVRGDALQSAILLLPDENREVLYALLEFFSHVAANSMFNQMTPNNLSVCWAPSLFHSGFVGNRSNSVSPRRKKPTGIPDAKELSETHASHDCLTFLIQNYRNMFTISNEKVIRCNFGYMEESKPLPLESLGEGLQVQNWCGYLYECTRATLKEGREKSRQWISSTSFDSAVDLSYKKVGDGHPLRLWKCSTEVEAPPLEVLHHILKERHIWDPQLLKWRVIEQLNDKSEVFQYVSGCQNISDYCVLRSWRTDLPRGACVIVETSVDHADATLLLGGVRGVVLASRYLIEPCGSGKSRIMHLARVDIKGRTPEWYNKCYGHISSQYLMKIRNFFKHTHTTEGPESKV